MRLLSTSAQLSRELMRLIEQYPRYYWAVAWGGVEFPHWHAFAARRANIRKAVFGTHFYQTHPELLRRFIGFPRVRFVLQPDGVFHPKLYLFTDGRVWECIVGSPNFTSAAVHQNSESAVLLSADDSEGRRFLTDVRQVVDMFWDSGEVMTEESYLRYHALWRRQQSRIRKLSGHYGGKRPKRPPVATPLITMSWDDYRRWLAGGLHPEIPQRLELLRVARELFRAAGSLVEMATEARRQIAGLQTGGRPDWSLFGSMKGAGWFHKLVNANDRRISEALDAIPLELDVSRVHFEEYVARFRRAVSDTREPIATATRLLAMKRPDLFLCFDTKNAKALSSEFGIPVSSMTFDRYWTEIIDRIMDSIWWNAPRPPDLTGGGIWDGRAAFLDARFYDPA